MVIAEQVGGHMRAGKTRRRSRQSKASLSLKSQDAGQSNQLRRELLGDAGRNAPAEYHCNTVAPRVDRWATFNR